MATRPIVGEVANVLRVFHAWHSRWVGVKPAGVRYGPRVVLCKCVAKGVPRNCKRDNDSNRCFRDALVSVGWGVKPYPFIGQITVSGSLFLYNHSENLTAKKQFHSNRGRKPLEDRARPRETAKGSVQPASPLSQPVVSACRRQCRVFPAGSRLQAPANTR